MNSLDFLILHVSMAFELSARTSYGEKLADLVQILIITRVWRFVSLMYDIMNYQYEQDEDKITDLEERIKTLENILQKNQIEIPSDPSSKVSENVTSSGEYNTFHQLS
mmetsp:Transcript_24133/g.26661  ORF Transcript_24133/g.26661 Transcript_24133/m.26661 type:complete len:108 (-) Transcript_24133:110-433(-)